MENEEGFLSNNSEGLSQYVGKNNQMCRRDPKKVKKMQYGPVFPGPVFVFPHAGDRRLRLYTLHLAKDILCMKWKGGPEIIVLRAKDGTTVLFSLEAELGESFAALDAIFGMQQLAIGMRKREEERGI